MSSRTAAASSGSSSMRATRARKVVCAFTLLGITPSARAVSVDQPCRRS